MDKHTIYCDSGLKEYCFVVDNEMPIVKEHPDKVTVNEGEYYALIAGLHHAVNKGFDDVEIFTDSLLVVSQFNRQWACQKKHLQRLRPPGSL